MSNLYFDNSATSWPKPESVVRRVADILKHLGANPGRSAHNMAMAGNEIVYSAREEIAEFFDLIVSSRVVFTSNCTESLNLAIKGTLEKGDHCITTSMEHNSVIRPLNRLSRDGIIEYDIAQADRCGVIQPKEIKKHLKTNTRLVICTHASNVTGTIQPIEAIADICKQRNIVFLVDAAQSAGNTPISVEHMGVDLLATSGHKYLLGPQGTGILLINTDTKIRPLKEGGTGTDSGNTTQPDTFPEKYESGTLNLLGIGGLIEGIRYLRETGIKRIQDIKKDLYAYLIEGLSNIDRIQLVGLADPEKNTGVASFRDTNNKTAELATVLGKRHGIKFRYGLHCAPLAHRTLGTFPEGAIRLSPGYKNTKNDVDILVNTIEKEIGEL